MTIIESVDFCKWMESASLVALKALVYLLTNEDWAKASLLVGCVSASGLEESANAKKVTLLTNQIMEILYS